MSDRHPLQELFERLADEEQQRERHENERPRPSNISILGQVHVLMEARRQLAWEHDLGPGDFVTQVDGIGYAKAPSYEQPALVIDQDVEAKRRTSEDDDSTGRAGVVEDLLIAVHYDKRVATFWFDGRYLRLHERAMREAYGDNWEEDRFNNALTPRNIGPEY